MAGPRRGAGERGLALDDVRTLDPADTRLVADTSPGFRRTRLWLDAVLRKTPMPLHHPELTVSAQLLADDRAKVDLQERCLLYVACSRARDELLLTWAGSPSPLLHAPS